MNQIIRVCVTTAVIIFISLMPANHTNIAFREPLTKVNVLNSVVQSVPKPVVMPKPIVMSRVVIVASSVEAARVEAFREEIARVEALRIEIARVEAFRVEAKAVASREAAKLNVEAVAFNAPAPASAKVSRGNTGRVITVQATAYTATGSRTATGTWPKEGRTIAVDPNVIKPGTRVKINNMDCGVGGVYFAEDTGGAVKGRIIDLYMDSQKACVVWGRRSIQIEILSN